MNNYIKLCLIPLFTFFFFIGCGAELDGDAASKVQDAYNELVTAEETAADDEQSGDGNIANESGGNADGDGMVVFDGSIQSNITLSNGSILIEIENGDFVNLGGQLVSVNDIITQVTNNGEEYPVTVAVVEIEGVQYIQISPPLLSPFNIDVVYQLVIIYDDTDYTYDLHFSADQIDKYGSLFADTNYFGLTGLYSGEQLLVRGKIVYGWDFVDNGSQFFAKVSDIPNGVTVYLSAYGIYDVDGYSNEVFYQRWESDNTPVKDFSWPNGQTYKITGTDSTLTDYDFRKTFLVLTAVDGDGNDITEEVASTLQVTISQ